MAWNDVKGAAPLIGVSADQVYRLCTAGKIRHRRLGVNGGRIRISDAAIEAYLASCEVGPENAPAAEAAAPTRARRRVVDKLPNGEPFRYIK